MLQIQIEEAQMLLSAQVEKINDTEQIPLLDALGRELAVDMVADMDQPPFSRSPLDGYAVRGEDVMNASKEHPVTLKVVGKIYAGYVYDGIVHEGEAVRLMTGAPIPDGADTVIRQEDTAEGVQEVTVYAPSKPFKNYCVKGEDYTAGTVLVRKGSVLNAGMITVIASLGRKEVEVIRRPRVSVISTGDEIIVPGEAWKPGKIYDSNRAYICARLAEFDNPPISSKHVSDEACCVAEQIREAAKNSDFIITTGGVSVGEKDILHEVVNILGAARLFWKVKMKPGSPTLAFMYDDTLVLCLSGNPFGAIANFELLGRRVMAKLTGQKKWLMETEYAVLQNDYRKPAGSRRFLRGYLENGKVTLNGKNQASGAISAMTDCNCLVEISPDMSGVQCGDSVLVYRL